MSHIPAELHYVDSHEWLRLEADGSYTVGITDHAQSLLGDVVYLELPTVGAVFAAGEQAGVVESVKAASDVYAPIAGTVVAINEGLTDAPETVNSDFYGNGWFFRIQPNAAVEGLLDATAYATLIGD